MRSKFKPTFLMACALLSMSLAPTQVLAGPSIGNISFGNSSSGNTGSTGGSRSSGQSGPVSGQVGIGKSCSTDEYRGNTIAPNFLETFFTGGGELSVEVDRENSKLNVRMPQYNSACMDLKAESRLQNNDHVVRLINNQKSYAGSELFSPEEGKENFSEDEWNLLVKEAKEQGNFESLLKGKKKTLTKNEIPWSLAKHLTSSVYEKKFKDLNGQEKALNCIIAKTGTKKGDSNNYDFDMSKIDGSLDHNTTILPVDIIGGEKGYDPNKTSRVLFGQYKSGDGFASTHVTYAGLNYTSSEKDNWSCLRASPLADNGENIYVHQTAFDRITSRECSANNPYKFFLSMRNLKKLSDERGDAGNYNELLGVWDKLFEQSVKDEKKRLEAARYEIQKEFDQLYDEFDPGKATDSELRDYYNTYYELMKKMDEQVVQPGLATAKALLYYRANVGSKEDKRDHKLQWSEDLLAAYQDEIVGAQSGKIVWPGQRIDGKTTVRGSEEYNDLLHLNMREVARSMHELESRSRLFSEVCVRSTCKKAKTIKGQYEKMAKVAAKEKDNLSKKIRTDWRDYADSKRGRGGSIKGRQNKIKRAQKKHYSKMKKLKGKYTKAWQKACQPKGFSFNTQKKCAKFMNGKGRKMRALIAKKEKKSRRKLDRYVASEGEFINKLNKNMDAFEEANEDEDDYDSYTDIDYFSEYVDYDTEYNPYPGYQQQYFNQYQFNQPQQYQTQPQQFSPVNNQYIY